MIPRIYIQAVADTIDEGQVAKFEIISETIAPPSDLLINLGVTQAGSYHLNKLPEEITMASRTKKVPLNMNTIDDDFVRPDGRISIVLKAGTGYLPVSGNGTNKPSAEITIRNTDTAVEVQVFTSTAKITEGDIAQFEIRASRNVKVPRMINFSILVQGDYSTLFASGVAKIFVLPLVAEKDVISFVFQAQPNEIDQPNGSITFTLKTGNEYSVAAAPLDSTIVIIEDNDGPPVISVSNANSVIEGSKAVFPVTAVGMSTVDVIVLFSLDEGNQDFLGGRTKEVAKLNAQSSSTTLSVQTIADGFDESNGKITVSIDADPLTPDTYIVGSANTATVLVIDDDKPPEISILDAIEIIEGNQSSFTVITTRVSSDIVTIIVSIDNGTNDFILGIPPSIITLPAKASSTILSINTEDDDEDEPDGDIDVTILPDTKNPPTYLVGSKNSATGKVIDDDIFTFSIDSKRLRYEENESVQFSINASIISRRDIPVSIQLTESAEYLADGEQVEQFIVKAGEQNSQQLIDLDDDNLIERNGTVTATVLDDPSYKLEGRDNFSVLIIDNDDPPLLSVVAESTNIRPNSTVDFKIVAEESITKEELMINISVDQNSNYIKWRTPKTIMLNSLKQEQLYQFATNTTFNEVNNGQIIISVLKDESVPAKYRVNQRANEISIPVMDLSNVPRVEPTSLPRISIADSVVNSILNLNLDYENSPTPTGHRKQRIPTVEFNSNSNRKSILPTIQIAAFSSTIEEGETATFQLSSSTKVVENLVVNLSQKTSGNFADFSAIEYVEIPSEKKVAIIDVPTIDDRNTETDGFIELSILSNSNYQLGKNTVARVNIIDSADRILRQQLLKSVNNEFIPRFLLASTQNSFNIAEQRIKSSFTSGIDNSISLNRSETIPEFLTTIGGNISNSDPVWNSMLYNSHFSLNLNTDNNTIFSTSVWGLGDTQYASGRFSKFPGNWSGEIQSGQLGIDATYNNSLVGMMMSTSNADITINSVQDSPIELNSKYTRYQPYFGLNFPEWNANTKVLASVGLLSVDLNYENYTTEKVENKTVSAAVAGEKVLYSGKNKLTGGDNRISVNGETSFARYAENLNLKEFSNLQKKYTRWNLGVHGTENIETQRGTTIEPKISIGLASETLFPVTNWVDLEFGAGLKAKLPIGISVTGMTETRLRKPKNGSRMSYLGLIEYDYGNDNLGMQVRFEPTWGETLTDQKNSLLGEEYLGIIGTPQEDANDFNLRSSVRYSIDLINEHLIMTPYSSILYSNNNTSVFSLGQRFQVGSNFNIELSSSQKIKSEDLTENSVRLAGKIKW